VSGNAVPATHLISGFTPACHHYSVREGNESYRIDRRVVGVFAYSSAGLSFSGCVEALPILCSGFVLGFCLFFAPILCRLHDGGFFATFWSLFIARDFG
jgi:hypothetical protein